MRFRGPWAISAILWRRAANAPLRGWVTVVAYAVVMRAIDEAHLLNIAVAQAWQGMGVGHRYMQHLIALARAEKLEMLFLEVRPFNAVGRHLYEGWGSNSSGCGATITRPPRAAKIPCSWA